MCGPGVEETVRENLHSRRGFLAAATAATAVATGLQEAVAAPQEPTGPVRVVDLSHPLTPEFPTYGGQPTFALERIASHADKGWNHLQWKVHEHTGTHLDAPIHRAAKGKTADQIDVAEFFLPLVVVDIKARAAANRLAEVTPADLKQWEKKHGPIPRGACVAMNSGWAAHVKSPRFRGADKNGTLHFPGFHEETAALLLEKHHALALAVDTLSIDIGPSKTFPTHTRWLPAGRWALECVANLDRVPANGAKLLVGIPKVAGATGGPCRVLALV